MDLAIQTRGLVKTFRTTVVLGGVTFAVRRGEVHAFLRSNTASKDTTMPILFKLLRKDARSAILSRGGPSPDAERLDDE
jgi:ABC-type multidrug transport system ATPase subunit